ncbi:MAG: transposase [Trebonia sp.]
MTAGGAGIAAAAGAAADGGDPDPAVIERTFGWLMRYRRLVRDYERTTANSEAMIYWATVIIMARRLARYEPARHPPSAGAVTGSLPQP